MQRHYCCVYDMFGLKCAREVGLGPGLTDLRKTMPGMQVSSAPGMAQHGTAQGSKAKHGAHNCHHPQHPPRACTARRGGSPGPQTEALAPCPASTAPPPAAHSGWLLWATINLKPSQHEWWKDDACSGPVDRSKSKRKRFLCVWGASSFHSASTCSPAKIHANVS